MGGGAISTNLTGNHSLCGSLIITNLITYCERTMFQSELFVQLLVDNGCTYVNRDFVCGMFSYYSAIR